MNEGKAGKNGGPTTDELLRILIAMAGRVAMPPERVRSIVSPSGSQKYVDAYNLCDGTVGLADVARLTGLDKANLNRSVNRWVEAAIVHRIGDDRVPKLLHIYPLSGSATREESALPLADRVDAADSAVKGRSSAKAEGSSPRRAREEKRKRAVRTEESQLPLAVTEGNERTDSGRTDDVGHQPGETRPS